MARKILSQVRLYLLASGRSGSNDGSVSVEDVRDVATEVALTTAVDASTAALPSLWAHDERLHRGDRPRRGR
jgi:hypothetical protein